LVAVAYVGDDEGLTSSSTSAPSPAKIRTGDSKLEFFMYVRLGLVASPVVAAVVVLGGLPEMTFRKNPMSTWMRTSANTDT